MATPEWYRHVDASQVGPGGYALLDAEDVPSAAQAYWAGHNDGRALGSDDAATSYTLGYDAGKRDKVRKPKSDTAWMNWFGAWTMTIGFLNGILFALVLTQEGVWPS